MSETQSFHAPGSNSLAKLEQDIRGNEVVFGPLISIAPTNAKINVVTLTNRPPEAEPLEDDQLITLVKTSDTTAPAGRVVVWFGRIWVEGTLQAVLAHRKLA